MTLKEAIELSGLGRSTILAGVKSSQFEASLPRGRRGGLQIERRTFEHWLLRRTLKNGNSMAKAAARRKMAAMGGAL